MSHRFLFFNLGITINVEEFFEQYINKRTSVSFTEENVSKSINPVRTLWSNSYLLSKCGTQHVRIFETFLLLHAKYLP